MFSLTFATLNRLLKEQFHNIQYTSKWILICTLIGTGSGFASAFFLWALKWAGDTRDHNLWLIWLLPIGGFFVGLMYHYFGKNVEAGNNLILEEIQNPEKVIPFRMAPLVLFGTIVTHLFGGSAGREGTAVQMGGAIADQFTKLFKLKKADKHIVLICGVSAGFASVFGTPLAGAIFGLEVFILGKINYKAILPSFLAAVIGDFVAHHSLIEIFHIHHTHYHIGEISKISPLTIGLSLIAGLLFGLAGKGFSFFTHFFGTQFKKLISYPPLRPVVGGIILATFFYFSFFSKYIGLGVPVIEAAFTNTLPWHDFALKLLFTAFTLGSGYKGGEVTPLFFIGATLGSALSTVMPLETGLLAGMGFVAVFAAAANTPIATIFMGIELFGHEAAPYLAIACVMAYLTSGNSGIYKSQIIGNSKLTKFEEDEGKKLGEV